jgi:hypothetical protein
MATSVFETSWRKVIGSFRSSQGQLLPPTFREQLFNYIVRGQIPPNPLQALLANDLETALLTPSNQTEASRLSAAYEFLRDYLPTGSWRSYDKLEIYSRYAPQQVNLREQYHREVRRKLRRDATKPILID